MMPQPPRLKFKNVRDENDLAPVRAAKQFQTLSWRAPEAFPRRGVGSGFDAPTDGQNMCMEFGVIGRNYRCEMQLKIPGVGGRNRTEGATQNTLRRPLGASWAQLRFKDDLRPVRATRIVKL
jgi:hypothetical protein